MGGAAAGEEADDQGPRRRAFIAAGLMHGREGGQRPLGFRNVVEADDAELLRDRQPVAPASLVDAQGDGVGHREYCGRRPRAAREQPEGRLRAALERGFHRQDLDLRRVDPQPGVGQGLGEAGEPTIAHEGIGLFRKAESLRPEGQDREPPVPELEDVLHQAVGGAGVVDADVHRRVDLGAVDRHEGHVAPLEDPDHLVVRPDPYGDQAVDESAARRFDDLALDRWQHRERELCSSQTSPMPRINSHR